MLETKIKEEVAADKATYINKLFNRIAPKYDLLNNLMTLGLHNNWKKKTIKLALKENRTPKSALDLCSGTGDLALILNSYSPKTQIICADYSSEMLEIAKKKIASKRLPNMECKIINVEEMPFKNNSFDLITIGFGLRNLSKKEKALEEIYQRLSPGGVFACIDLGHPRNKLWENLYLFLFTKLIPFLGKVFAKSEEAYTYLPTSLQNWYKQEELKELLLKKGFKSCFYKNFFGGATAAHIAVKP